MEHDTEASQVSALMAETPIHLASQTLLTAVRNDAQYLQCCDVQLKQGQPMP
jgi:hypothetical protein